MQMFIFTLRIQKDETIKVKLIYIPYKSKQNYPFYRLNLLIDKFQPTIKFFLKKGPQVFNDINGGKC